MATPIKEQLTAIGQQLAEIDAQLEILLADQKKLRESAFKIMKRGRDRSIKTVFGCFSLVAGRKTKSYTSAEVIKAQEALKIAQVRADNRGEFTTKVGEESIRFIAS